jgi:CRISPR-associated protein Cas2
LPLTVVTLSKVPMSLRGDLTKWMQEVSVGVYVGNFNVKVRDKLWERITKNVGSGRATMSYACRNELGYDIKTYNTATNIIDYDGIPLVQIPDQITAPQHLKYGFSNAAKFRKIKKIKRNSSTKSLPINCVFIDLETDGLDEFENHIIEIGAVKVNGNHTELFDKLISSPYPIPKAVINLTGIDNNLLSQNGTSLYNALQQFKDFIADAILVGYSINFDIRFLNHNLKSHHLDVINNNVVDILNLVKKEKLFIDSYKLQNVLKEYGIDKKVPHRASADCKLIMQLSTKVNNFDKILKRRG